MIYYNYKKKGDETMTLNIKEERKIERWSKYFVNWTKSEFEELVRLTKRARVKKDGTFYKRD